MMQRKHLVTPLLATAAAALLLVGCDRREDTTVGQRADEPPATQTAPATPPSSTDTTVGQKVDNAAEKVGSAVEDAAITASVNAELAKDPKLSSFRIDVDTANGAVKLSGTAPDLESRERATRLASNVKGVTNVDNRLEVRG